MQNEAVTQVLGRECSGDEISRFEAFKDAFGEDDIEEAARLFDGFPEAERENLIDFMRRNLDAVTRPAVKVAPTTEGARPDPNEPIIEINEKRAAVSGWGDEEALEPAFRVAAEAFRATPPRDRRRLEGRRLTTKDCQGLVAAHPPRATGPSRRSESAKRAAPRRRESRPGPSRKRTLTRSSSRSADSGEEGPSDEPPQGGRLCVCNCGESIDHRAPQAKYLNEHHAAADRQRRKRDRARDWSPDVSRRDPYFRFEVPTFEQLRQRIEHGCRCNGHHIADAEDGHCIKCGHRRGRAIPSAESVSARSFVSSRAPARHNPRYGDRKRKPVREYVDREAASA